MARFLSRINSRLRLFSYQSLLRIGGFAGLMYLVVYREKPDPTLIIAMCAMMGLPTFWEFDRSRKEVQGDGGAAEGKGVGAKAGEGDG